MLTGGLLDFLEQQLQVVVPKSFVFLHGLHSALAAVILTYVEAVFPFVKSALATGPFPGLIAKFARTTPLLLHPGRDPAAADRERMIAGDYVRLLRATATAAVPCASLSPAQADEVCREIAGRFPPGVISLVT